MIITLLATCIIPSSITHKINKNNNQRLEAINGNILFSPMTSKMTYLIDPTGSIKHMWTNSYNPGLSVYNLENGEILRAIRKTYLAPAGSGGGVQKISWDGQLLWDFNYYTDDYLSHHDIEPMPNGNVLILAWEYKTRTEAIQAGRNPDTYPINSLMPDHIIEVKPTGPTSGDIIWEWHVWDHLIQDFDSTKDNYGVVKDHPELIDINFGYTTSDWLHMNSIDYHEEFDQIMVSVRNFNEIWIIDHSTSTAEAAGHTGGNSGKGGDLIYRWGNPIAYRRGTINGQKLFSHHDATWIESGYPGEGNILIFNNGNNRPDGSYSSVDEIVPPADSNGDYFLEPGFAYGPDDHIWRYIDSEPTNFYALYLSGAQRLPDGNTLICDGPRGRFFEVTPDLDIIWEYTSEYPNPINNQVFKISYIPSEGPNPDDPDLNCEGTLSWDDIVAGETVTGSFIVKNDGGTDSSLNWKIDEWPEWGTWTFNPDSGTGLSPDNDPVIVNISVVTPREKNTEFNGFIKIINTDDPDDYEVIYVYLKTPNSLDMTVSMIYNIFIKFLNRHPFLNILYNLITIDN